ncbi:MAG: hypothetical protein ACR2GK_07445 [Gemmatimonadaceae bacterium]
MNVSFLQSEAFNRAEASLAIYRAARSELKDLGVLRSERTVQSDYGEWLVSNLLGLELATSGVQAGYDAVDTNGWTYQIKTRLVGSLTEPTSFDLRGLDHSFDFLIGVLLSRSDSRLLAIVKVAHDAVRTRAKLYRSRLSLRWKRNCWEADWVEVLYKAPPLVSETERKKKRGD